MISIIKSRCQVLLTSKTALSILVIVKTVCPSDNFIEKIPDVKMTKEEKEEKRSLKKKKRRRGTQLKKGAKRRVKMIRCVHA